jgi:hypothetical protein
VSANAIKTFVCWKIPNRISRFAGDGCPGGIVTWSFALVCDKNIEFLHRRHTNPFLHFPFYVFFAPHICGFGGIEIKSISPQANRSHGIEKQILEGLFRALKMIKNQGEISNF